ncbi:MAG TPA: pitrilysin family protein [Burkholderiales bacterium]|nr:pitrilysin family protein [Burkholderiales bacterium]
MHRLIVMALCSALAGGCAAVQEKTLDNGLRVIVKEDHRSPVVVSQLWYKVASIDEPDGITGVSHVLEHMMFKGTERLKPNEFSRIIAEHGGRENAFTSSDFTGYHQQLEKSRLRISFELEADRMQNLRLSPQEFAKEIKVVMEERRLRTDDSPDGLLHEKFIATAYQVHSYRNPIIGWMHDLENMKVEDARQWYERFYAPNNAVLAVVGDVRPDEVFDLARKYFGKNRPRAVNRPTIPAEPPQTAERRVRVAAPAEVPQVLLGYHAPGITTADTPDPYALAVAAAVLDGGGAARLPRELVRERQLAAGVEASYSPLGRGPELFVVGGTPATGHNVEELEKALRTQVARLRDEPVSAAELKRIKAQVVASDVYARDSVYYQASRLAQIASLGLDLNLPELYVERIKRVTAEQVQAAARKYLLDTNLTVAVLDPLPIQPGAKRAPSPGVTHAR